LANSTITEQTKSQKDKPGSIFEGPIFLVGLPRSGTKLLRELLNNHSRIAITIKESNFLPYFYHRRNAYGPLDQPGNFDRFYKDFSETKFFKRLDESSRFIDKELWSRQIVDWSFAGVMEAFYKAYARHFNKQIWGDKTPSYLVQVPLLKSLFPGAKFIHIYRDGRDQALSIYKVYKKNIYTSAQRWTDGIMKFRRDAARFAPGDTFEVQYEKLTDSTEETMRSICDWLGIPFEKELTEMNRTTEFLTGAASKSTGILKKNHGKWQKELSPHQVARFEKICGSLLADMGYPVSYKGPASRLNKLEMGYHTVLDAINQLIFEIGYRGRREGLKGFLQLRKKAWFYHDEGIEEKES